MAIERAEEAGSRNNAGQEQAVGNAAGDAGGGTSTRSRRSICEEKSSIAVYTWSRARGMLLNYRMGSKFKFG